MFIIENTNPETPQAFQVIVFSKDNCTRCKYVTRHLDRKGIAYAYLNVDHVTDPSDRLGGLTPRDFLINTLGVREMPVIVVTNETMPETSDDIITDPHAFDIIGPGMSSSIIEAIDTAYDTTSTVEL